MRILVCGSRDFEDADTIESILVGYLNINNGVTIIEGGARGADSIAGEWAERGYPLSREHLRFPANWDKYGKSAGYIRNKQMLDEGKPDLVLAFVNKPLKQSKGTAGMVKIAKEAGVKTVVIYSEHTRVV